MTKWLEQAEPNKQDTDRYAMEHMAIAIKQCDQRSVKLFNLPDNKFHG